ncbi:MAG: adenylate kinase [Rickettsiales bacterium]|nr:adenylate kinase [Rickettsiales bacterium]
MNIIFLGAPGSGKGTQAVMLAKKLEITAVSTGEVLRKEVLQQSDIGKLAKSYMDSGKLVPDEVVIDIIKKQVAEESCGKGFILDGFPRNIAQAVKLDEMLRNIGKKIDIVFNFDVSEDVLVKRILGRFSCKGCGEIYNRYFKLPKKDGVCDKCGSIDFENRKDDSEETINNRLKVYHESTFPLIDYYKKNNLLLSIRAVESPPLVFEALVEVTYKVFQK